MSTDPAPVREIDLGEPLTGVAGGPDPAWLRVRVRFGARTIGHLLLALPAGGLTGGEVGSAVAARFGATARRPYDDRQPRSRSRGSTCSE